MAMLYTLRVLLPCHPTTALTTLHNCSLGAQRVLRIDGDVAAAALARDPLRGQQALPLPLPLTLPLTLTLTSTQP